MSIISEIETKKREDLFTEIYRPKKLDECIGLEELKKDFKEYIKKKDIPPMIIAGPAGIGKTSIALILAREVCGMGNTLILDASVENNVAVMRGKVKEHFQTYGSFTNVIKIVIFDEADNMSKKAQQTLRRTIEKFSKYCRPIFIVNYLRKLIDPIQSRCKLYQVTKPNNNDILKRLEQITQEQSLSLSRENLMEIIKDSYGDIRKCVLILDAINKGASLSSAKRNFNDKTLINACLKGKFATVRNYLDEKISDSEDIRDVLKYSLNCIIDSEKIPLPVKVSIIELLGEAEFRLTMTSDYGLTSQWLCSKIYQAVINYKNNK